MSPTFLFATLIALTVFGYALGAAAAST